MVGRALPTPGDEQPKIYRMKLWATNEVRAKSKFWSVSSPDLDLPRALVSAALMCLVVCAQVLPEEAQEGEEGQRPDARHQRGISLLSSCHDPWMQL